MKTEMMYKLVLTGRLKADYSIEEVKEALSRLLKRDAAEVDRIFASAPVVVKTKLPESEVQRYLDTFGKTGAVFDAMIDFVPLEGFTEPDPEPVVATPPAPPPPSAPTYAQAAAAAAAQAAAAAEEIRCPKCFLLQPKRTLCNQCGVNIPAFAASQASAAIRSPAPAPAPQRSFQLPEHSYDGRMARLFEIWFDGRIGRVRYLAWNIPGALAALLLSGIFATLEHVTLLGTILLVFVGLLAIAYFSMRIAALRLHDFGQTGWLSVLVLVPGLNILMFVALLCIPGNADDNAYGDLPKPNTPLLYLGAVGVFAISLLWGLFR